MSPNMPNMQNAWHLFEFEDLALALPTCESITFRHRWEVCNALGCNKGASLWNFRMTKTWDLMMYNYFSSS